MKRYIFLIIIFAAFGELAAQNNPYDIDDECYEYYMEAENLVGTPGFNIPAEKLLRTANRKDDTKAITLYYVLQLRNLSTTARNKEVPDEYDAEMEKAHEQLKKAAKTYGYSQYYYYSYSVIQNYYYNHRKTQKTFELINKMQSEAIAENDAYGLWMSDRYLIDLYVAQNDYVSAKRYVKRCIDTFESTDDETIKRQSACRLYCDMADTYPIGADSVRINIAKALNARKVHMDTLRCNYHVAKIAALDKDAPRYLEARDYCLGDPNLVNISRSANTMFGILDKLMEGTLSITDIPFEKIQRLREIKYIANIAEEYGHKELAFEIEKRLVVEEEKHIAKLNQSKLSELEVNMGKTSLQANLADREQKIQRILRIFFYSGLCVLFIITIILLFYIQSLRKFNKNLKEANEKALAADAAKTRFVQNMSHEVRTPLNAIVGFSQLLSLPDGTFTPEEKDEFSGHIINNTKMLTMLLDDILNASAMDTGNYRISIEDGECSFICQAAISSAEHRLQPGVKMIYANPEDERFNFRTDPQRAQQIIINLLTNACKHTTAGEIRVGWSLDENPGEVTFWVTDTGPGVPEDKAEVIFDRFAKLNEFVQGTGLGLSICRDIASRMRGRVYLDTTYKVGGARFVFVVPAEPNETIPA